MARGSSRLVQSQDVPSIETFSAHAEAPAAVAERHFTAGEIAKAWQLSVETVRSIFREEPGVLKISRPATKYKRGYMTLRIPREVAMRVHRRFTE